MLISANYNRITFDKLNIILVFKMQCDFPSYAVDYMPRAAGPS
jgi:hypothetical protein